VISAPDCCVMEVLGRQRAAQSPSLAQLSSVQHSLAVDHRECRGNKKEVGMKERHLALLQMQNES